MFSARQTFDFLSDWLKKNRQQKVNRLPFRLSILSFCATMGSSWSEDMGAMCCGRQRGEGAGDSEETKKWDARQLEKSGGDFHTWRYPHNGLVIVENTI